MERSYMICFREKLGKTMDDMAKECECSPGLIRLIEEDERNVTHPNIAKRIMSKYYLTKEQMEMMIPENYRKSSPRYDPDKYKIEPVFIERPEKDMEVVMA